jgi:hypothetical protein
LWRTRYFIYDQVSNVLLLLKRGKISHSGYFGFIPTLRFLIMLTTWHPLSARVGTKLIDKRRSFGRYCSFADSGHGVFYFFFFFCFLRQLRDWQEIWTGWLRNVVLITRPWAAPK